LYEKVHGSDRKAQQVAPMDADNELNECPPAEV